MEQVIKTNNLTKKFGSFTAVDNISFYVNKGEIFGFLGANGAGKTTAMRMLCGLSKPTSGTGSVAGCDISKEYEKIKKNIGYMSQKFSLYEDLTVAENIKLFAGIYGMPLRKIKEKSAIILERLELADKKDTLVKYIPIGWKQKLAFSVAVFHEPTGGVDPEARRQFWEMIYEAADNGITIFVTTHYMDEAEYCDRISIMVHGKIAALAAPKDMKKEYNAVTMDEVFRKLVAGTFNQE